MTTRLLALILLISFASGASAARVELRDGTIVFGKIENLKEGEDLVIDTEHMDNVTIDWDAIVRIDDARAVSVLLFDGTRITGPIVIDEDGLRVGGPDAPLIDTTKVFQIEEFNQSVWEGFEFRYELGMNLVRGNNTVTSISTAAGAIYDGVKFETSVNWDAILNEQVEGPDTRRSTLGANYTYKLPKNWTVTGLYQFTTDEQQGLEARSIAGGAIGKRVINNRRFRLTLDAGAVLNFEDFEDAPEVESLEGLLGATVRWRSVRDIDFDASLFAFPNLEISGRWRTQFDTALTIDLWGDIDFKLSGYSSYDTDPPAGNTNHDWGTDVRLSWKWD